jgi:predicted dehydrogenase
VDDDATLIVSYPSADCIIQASWNWPFGRKDMEIYGESGYIMADNRSDMRLRNRSLPDEIKRKITAEEVHVFEDPFCYFIHVIRGKITMKPYDPYSLENNMMVVRILDAAREAAKTGESVKY